MRQLAEVIQLHAQSTVNELVSGHLVKHRGKGGMWAFQGVHSDGWRSLVGLFTLKYDGSTSHVLVSLEIFLGRGNVH